MIPSRQPKNMAFRKVPKIEESPLPVPLQILMQYQLWHSEESLRRNQLDRKYAIAFYACPLQAGNRIHHFLTGAWARSALRYNVTPQFATS